MGLRVSIRQRLSMVHAHVKLERICLRVELLPLYGEAKRFFHVVEFSNIAIKVRLLIKSFCFHFRHSKILASIIIAPRKIFEDCLKNLKTIGAAFGVLFD